MSYLPKGAGEESCVRQSVDRQKLTRISVPRNVSRFRTKLTLSEARGGWFNQAHSNDLASDAMISATLGDKSSGFEDIKLCNDSLQTARAECCASRA